MARAASEEPEGLVYRPDVLSRAEEEDVLAELMKLRFDPIILHGQEARRTARHYGLSYDYEARTPQPGEPPPGWIARTQAKAANLAEVPPEDLVQVRVQRYPVG